MIRSVLSIPESKLAELDDAPKLTSHDRNVLRDIIEILTPFEEATDFIQVSCIPSAGYVMPCVRGLSHHVQGMASKYHSSFVLTLRQSLRKRLGYYEEQQVYIIAAILDPRFKLRWCFEETDYTDIILSVLEQDIPPTPVDVGLQIPHLLREQNHYSVSCQSHLCPHLPLLLVHMSLTIIYNHHVPQ